MLFRSDSCFSPFSLPSYYSLHLYEEALSAAREEGPSAVREHSVSNHSALPDERTLQLLLLEGVFGTSFTDDSGRDVHILDFGNWNKSAGPDFLNARICINGVPQSGDIELDPTPEDCPIRY